MLNWEDCLIQYVNLEERVDRNDHMIKELNRIGINATRRHAYTPDDIKKTVPHTQIQRMLDTTPGACACMYSQMGIMINAYAQGKSAFVMEDDLVFASDTKERLSIFQNWLNENDPDFDLAWLGATFHKEPTWHKLGHQDKLPCNCTLNKDWEETNHPNIVRTYGIWSTYAYIVNAKSIPKITLLLSEIMPESIGIDYSMIALQPLLKTYAFVPGMIKQFDNQSNIGNGITKFSGFSKLGEYWWANEYDKDKKYI